MTMASRDEVCIPRTAAYSDRLAKEFLQLRIDDEHTDFRILSETKSFGCHKAILSANSPVLKAMMKSHTVEASSGEVTLNNIPLEVLELLLHYMYTGEITIPTNLLQSTVEACDYFELLELKEHCLNQAATLLKPSNTISWYNFAESLGLDEIKNKCSKILSSSFCEVAKELEFFELSLTEVSSFITSVQETGVDADDMLDATFGWMNYHQHQRADNMEAVLQQILLVNCSVECLKENMENYQDLLDSHPGVCKILSDAYRTLLQQKESRQMRRQNARVLMLGGETFDEDTNDKCWELDSLCTHCSF